MASPTFRRLQREDFPLLERWLSMPHVDAWWHERLDAAGVEAKYGPGIDGREPVHVYLIEHDTTPIGWIQWYRWSDFATHGAQLGVEPASAGIDLAIGEPTMLGRGLGADAIRAFVDDVVFADRSIRACVADPEADNTRSVRAFQKAGFAIMRTVTLAGETTPREVVRKTAVLPCLS